MVNILIVEDSKVVIETLKEALNNLGYNSLTVITNGEEAIEIIKKQSIDLIIMDIVLDGVLDGIETSKIINNSTIIPIIYLTQDIRNYSRLPAASVYLNKPFTENELRYNIQIVLEQHELKKKLQAKIEWFSALFKYSTEGIIMFNQDYLINSVNKKYKEIFSYDYNYLINQPIRDIIGSHLSFRELKEKFLARNSLEIEKELIFNSGRSKHFLIKGIPIFNDKEFIGGYLTYIDITDLKRKEEKIRYISEHDAMTGLYNRRYFQKKLDEFSQNENAEFSLIIGDMNNLKNINDTYGHSVGDQFIQLAARVLRESLPTDAIISRIGGDEFGVILLDKTLHMCSNYCKLIHQNSKKYTIKKNLEENLSISIGYAIKDTKIQDSEELFHEADQKMYKAKKKIKLQEIL